MEKQLLTIEYDTDRLEIHGNEVGLRYLIERLEELIDNTREGKFDHIHLMTEEWGGNELSSASQGAGQIVNHAAIFCWKNG